jgi:hypothetical protein
MNSISGYGVNPGRFLLIPVSGRAGGGVELGKALARWADGLGLVKKKGGASRLGWPESFGYSAYKALGK